MIGNAKQIIDYLFEQDKEKLFEIKEKKQKRSLNANAYFYVLQNKLADVLKVSNDELHFELIKRYSSVILVTLPDEVNPKGYFKYYETYKKGTIQGKKQVQYKVYRPSAEMDTKEFSRLLDGLISECKEVDIETLTPNQLLELEGYEKI